MALFSPACFILFLQCLGGEIEDISCSDLDNLDYEQYFLILQKLKEKAKAIENLFNETEDISDLEKQLMKVMPTMNTGKIKQFVSRKLPRWK